MPDAVRPIIGILGAGKVGTAIARQALAAGFEVLIATAKPPQEIAMIVEITTPGAKAVSADVLAYESDIVVVAVPLRKYRTLNPAQLAGKIVVDVMNYWPPTEGVIPDFETGAASSEVIQAFLAESRVVRTLNHVGYHEIEDDALPPGHTDRRAVAIAGNDPAARAKVARFIDQLGFDPVDAGPLAAARAFDIGSDIFASRKSRPEMEHLLAGAARTADSYAVASSPLA